MNFDCTLNVVYGSISTIYSNSNACKALLIYIVFAAYGSISWDVTHIQLQKWHFRAQQCHGCWKLNVNTEMLVCFIFSVSNGIIWPFWEGNSTLFFFWCHTFYFSYFNSDGNKTQSCLDLQFPCRWGSAVGGTFWQVERKIVCLHQGNFQ